MDARSVISIVAAAAATLGLFLPIARTGQLYVNLSHLGGLASLSTR